jgi:tRNA(fMet)-specific endonuclease VapC
MELEYGAAKRPEVAAFRERIARLKEVFPRVEACWPRGGARGGRRARAARQPEAQPLPIGPYDALLAGHALALGAVLVTDNTREFARVPGLVTESWRE